MSTDGFLCRPIGLVCNSLPIPEHMTEIKNMAKPRKQHQPMRKKQERWLIKNQFFKRPGRPSPCEAVCALGEALNSLRNRKLAKGRVSVGADDESLAIGECSRKQATSDIKSQSKRNYIDLLS